MEKKIQREGKPTTDSSDKSNIDNIKKAGEDLLAAGDAAIAKALSGNSEDFLKATRQSGGQ